MRTFLIGTLLAIVVAVATGLALQPFEVGSDRFNSTEHVRL